MGSHKGWKHTEEAKRKISQAKKGKKRPDLTQYNLTKKDYAKMSRDFKGRKNPWSVVYNKTKKDYSFMKGENNPTWNPNRKERFYPYTERHLDEETRKTILAEQDNICLICDKKIDEKECDSLGRWVALHHIDYDKQNDNQENYCALHLSCHTKTNANREYWEKWLKEKRRKNGRRK